AQRTLHTLRVPEPGQPVGLRQRPEASCQTLRGLWGATVTVFADQDLPPEGPHAWGTRPIGHARPPSLASLAAPSWHRARGRRPRLTGATPPRGPWRREWLTHAAPQSLG